MTTPQYNRQAQAWDNKTPDESEDGLPTVGFCPWCSNPLANASDGVVFCIREMRGCDYDSSESEQSNRARWLREEADRMRGEECENEADRRSSRYDD